MNENILNVIRENYTGYKDNQGVTFYEWVKFNAENEDRFFEGLFRGWNGDEDNLSDEQREEFNSWLKGIEIDSNLSKLIADKAKCYIDVYWHQEIKENIFFVLFNFEGTTYGETAAVIYEDGTVFTPRDWQSGEYPTEAAEINKYDWLEIETTKEAVIIDGLPRLF